MVRDSLTKNKLRTNRISEIQEKTIYADFINGYLFIHDRQAWMIPSRKSRIPVRIDQTLLIADASFFLQTSTYPPTYKIFTIICLYDYYSYLNEMTRQSKSQFICLLAQFE